MKNIIKINLKMFHLIFIEKKIKFIDLILGYLLNNHFLRSGSSFSIYSIVLNKGEIILDKSVQDNRNNLFRNIDYFENIRLFNINKFNC